MRCCRLNIRLLAYSLSLIALLVAAKIDAASVKVVLAEAHNLPVFQPSSLRPQDNQRLVADLGADIMVVVAYGLILPKAVLEMPRLGCINVHGSLLPRWRGAAPIQRSLWAGDSETGVTIMQMDVGLDTGDMLYKLSCPITAEDTSGSLYDKLAELGPQGLLATLAQLANGTARPEVQDESLVCHAEKLSKEEARIDWSLSAAQLERCIRAFNPWPMSWLEIDGQPVKVWRASVIAEAAHAEPGTIVAATKQGIQVATGDGILSLESLQPAGKKSDERPEFSIPAGSGLRLAPSRLTVVSSGNPGSPGIFITAYEKNINLRSHAPRLSGKSLKKGSL